MAKRQQHISEEVMLACREQGCAWDYLSTGWYVTYDRYGRRVWERIAPCIRGCTSQQRQRKEPWLGGRRLSSKVWHPPEWYEFKGYYFSEARDERIRRQLAVNDQMETIYPMGFKGEKPRENDPQPATAG